MPVLMVAILSFTVHYLLLLAAAGLCRYPPSLVRSLLGSAVGAAYAAACLLPGLYFLGNTVGRLVCILLMGTAAFGWKQPRLLGALLVLCLGMDAVTSDTGVRGTLAGLCAVFLLWLLLRRGAKTVPVTIRCGEKELALTALQDTGNFLRDPVTGSGVLVIGPEAARALTGLTAAQLRTPLETMGVIPGLRLIPYKAVGGSGFLLGLKLEHVCIGNRKGSCVVAFAPENLEGSGRFDALTGGMA